MSSASLSLFRNIMAAQLARHSSLADGEDRGVDSRRLRDSRAGSACSGLGSAACALEAEIPDYRLQFQLRDREKTCASFR